MAKENEEKQPEVEVAVVEAEPVSAPAEETAAEEAPKSARDTFREKVRGFAPDRNYEENEDTEFEAANELIAALEEKGRKYDEFTDKLLKRFNEDPEDAEVFLRYADGEPLVSAIVSVKGREGLQEPAEGEEGYDAFVKGLEENRANRAKNEALIEELKKNAAETEAAFNQFCADNGIEGEDKDALWNEMFGDLENISKGKFTPEIMGRYLKSRNHDADVEAAMEQGKADGRNEKIEAERKRMEGSGLPNGNGGARADEEIPVKRNGTADWLEKMGRRR